MSNRQDRFATSGISIFGATAAKSWGELAQLAVSIVQTQHPIRGQRYIRILRFCSLDRQVSHGIPAGGLLTNNNVNTGRTRPLSRSLQDRRLRSHLGGRDFALLTSSTL